MSGLAFMRLVGRAWWVIALTVIGVVGPTAYRMSRQAPIYEGSTTAIVWPDENVAGQQKETVLRSLDTLDRRSVIATYAKIPSSRTIRQRAQAQLNLSPAELGRYRVRTAVMPDTNVLRISVEGPDPRLVAAMANSIAEQANSYATDFSAVYRLKVLDQAVEPNRPIRPLFWRHLGTSAVLGLLVGLGWVFLFGYVRQSRHAPAEPTIAESKEAFSPLPR